jgi:hypothetical protein
VRKASKKARNPPRNKEALKPMSDKIHGEIHDAARRHGPEAIALLWQIASEAEADNVRVTAIKEILERGYGKPGQAIAGDGDNPIVVTAIERVIIDPKTH